MTPSLPAGAASTSAQYVRVSSADEDDRDLHSRQGACRMELEDMRRLLVFVAIFLAIIAALTFTGYSVIVTGAVLVILAGCCIGLIAGLVSTRRRLREIEAQLPAAKSPS